MNIPTIYLLFTIFILNACNSYSLKIKRPQSKEDLEDLENKFKKFLETRPNFNILDVLKLPQSHYRPFFCKMRVDAKVEACRQILDSPELQKLDIDDEYLKQASCMTERVRFTQIPNSDDPKEIPQFQVFQCPPTPLFKEAHFLTDGDNNVDLTSLYLLHRAKNSHVLRVIAHISVSEYERDRLKKYKNKRH